MTSSLTRREFLGTLAAGGMLARAHCLQEPLSLAAEPDAAGSSPGSPILVAVNLAGGNDGLNTVVPFANEFYLRARPRLAIPRSEVLALNDELGLHPELRGLAALYDEGELAIVQGVGYPDQNRSHFRSSDIWETASDADRTESSGWLGRYLDAHGSGCCHEGLAIGGTMPKLLLARKARTVTFLQLERYRLLQGSFSVTGDAPQDELFREMNAVVRVKGASGWELETGARGPGADLAFLQQTALDALVSSQSVAAAASCRVSASYGASSIGRDLGLVARLIGGGLSTRVFCVVQKGYDSHADQLPAHARRLSELDAAIAAFAAEMKAQGNWKRVMLLTYSEFGRRLAENGNEGTDHGAASVLFLAGGGIRPGFLGRMPSLAPGDLLLGDPRFTTDFRSVYALVIEKHLDGESLPVLEREFPALEGA